jgi:hypothetical protein
MLVVPGVPLSAPVRELNEAQDGRFEIKKESVSPSASSAVGLNV